MILGVGIDMIEIERIEKAADKAAFLARIFTEGELRLYEDRGRNASVLAGCFAGKEAVAKALGTGFSGFMPIDVEILRDEAGKPYASLHNGALERFRAMNASAVHISITNTKTHAAATSVIDGYILH
jgi:holo-[acyl-carrier protein] synthase